MIDFDNIRLQAAARALSQNLDLRFFLDTIQEDILNDWRNSEPNDIEGRELAYLRWKHIDDMRDTIKTLTENLERSKK